MGDYDKSLSLNPENARTHYGKGYLFKVQGETLKAINSFKESD